MPSRCTNDNNVSTRCYGNRENSNLVRYSPKKLHVHLFTSKLCQEEASESAMKLNDITVATSSEVTIGEPQLPRQRRRSARYDTESSPQVHSTVKAHYPAIYYEACDLLSGELERRLPRTNALWRVLRSMWLARLGICNSVVYATP